MTNLKNTLVLTLSLLLSMNAFAQGSFGSHGAGANLDPLSACNDYDYDPMLVQQCWSMISNQQMMMSQNDDDCDGNCGRTGFWDFATVAAMVGIPALAQYGINREWSDAYSDTQYFWAQADERWAGALETFPQECTNGFDLWLDHRTQLGINSAVSAAGTSEFYAGCSSLLDQFAGFSGGQGGGFGGVGNPWSGAGYSGGFLNGMMGPGYLGLGGMGGGGGGGFYGGVGFGNGGYMGGGSLGSSLLMGLLGGGGISAGVNIGAGMPGMGMGYPGMGGGVNVGIGGGLPGIGMGIPGAGVGIGIGLPGGGGYPYPGGACGGAAGACPGPGAYQPYPGGGYPYPGGGGMNCMAIGCPGTGIPGYPGAGGGLGVNAHLQLPNLASLIPNINGNIYIGGNGTGHWGGNMNPAMACIQAPCPGGPSGYPYGVNGNINGNINPFGVNGNGNFNPHLNGQAQFHVGPFAGRGPNGGMQWGMNGMASPYGTGGSYWGNTGGSGNGNGQWNGQYNQWANQMQQYQLQGQQQYALNARASAAAGGQQLANRGLYEAYYQAGQDYYGRGLPQGGVYGNAGYGFGGGFQANFNLGY